MKKSTKIVLTIVGAIIGVVVFIVTKNFIKEKKVIEDIGIGS